MEARSNEKSPPKRGVGVARRGYRNAPELVATPALNFGARDGHKSSIVMTDVEAGLHSEVGTAVYPLGRPRVLNLSS
jgi:hypothetical protein